MEFVQQTLDLILKSLGELEVSWQDETASNVIEYLEGMAIKDSYDEEDIKSILDDNIFDDGKLICRLFLGLSKDSFTIALNKQLGKGGQGIKRYNQQQDHFINSLKNLGLLEAMIKFTNRATKWSDVLVERLRSGRGSAISGQRRGRELEDFTEDIIKGVFGTSYEVRCQFAGKRNLYAKCDFAIPSKDNPRILIESKGYGATGSKMSDVVGDIDAIVNAKRPDTTLFLITDGLTWHQRQSDLAKLVERQNQGEISRIYTTSMAEQIEDDLRTLKDEYQL